MNRTRIPSMLWQPAILIRLAALLSIVVLVTGSDDNCKGLSDSAGGGTTAPEVPGVTLSITSPLPLEVVPGGTGKVTVAVTRINGFTGPVQLILFDELGLGTACFSATPDVTVPVGGSSIDMTVQVSAACQTGTRSFKVSAASTTGYLPASADVAATVVAPGAFAISATPASFPLPGATIHVTAQIVRNGYTGSITIARGSESMFVSSVTITQPGTGNTADLAIVIASSAGRGSNFLADFTATGPGAPDQSFYVSGNVHGDDFTMGYSPQPVNVPQNGYATIQLTFAQPTNTTPISGVTGTFTATVAGLTGSIPQQLLPNGIPFGGTLFASAAVPVGDYTMTLTGTALGVANQTIPVAVHVFASSYTYAVQTAPLTVAPGVLVPDAITITRNNMPDAVSFTGAAVDDPNIVISSAAATTGNTSSISVFVPTSSTLGQHNISLHGVSPGHNDVVQTFAIVVQVPVNNTTWSFCPTSGLPLWMAVQDGTNAWTQVTGATNAYAFAISSAKGGVAYVLLNNGTTELHIFYGSQTELQTQGGALCAGGSGSTKSISGSTINTGTAASARIALGSAFTSVQPATGTFQLTTVPPGTLDLVAASLDGANPPNAVRMLLQRNLNLATGGTVGTLDFAGAGFLPTVSTLSVSAPGQTVIANYNLHTANNPLSLYYSTIVTGTSIPLFGVPVGQQVAGDLHYVLAQALSGTTDVRFAGVAFGTIAPKTLAFGSALTAPAPSAITPPGPYARLRMVLSIQGEYNKFFDVSYQQSGTNRSVDIQTTAAYAGSVSSLTVDIPDFTAVAGWTNSWGPLSGFATSWLVTASSWSGSGGITSVPLVEGATFTSASKQGSFTP